jgi:hypothetical protein
MPPARTPPQWRRPFPGYLATAVARRTADAISEQRLAVGGGNTRAPTRRPGGLTGLERRLDGGGNNRNRPADLGGRYWDRTSDLLGVNE